MIKDGLDRKFEVQIQLQLMQKRSQTGSRQEADVFRSNQEKESFRKFREVDRIMNIYDSLIKGGDVAEKLREIERVKGVTLES